ncbi:Protein CBG18518 [Caenorhabditis briggsae]|uniref:Protein CBG18518 n=1 Tax=Caenorhabditis briggsae TaxID=6238 RepID=A8XTH4_CAEBR|nr:Protein CBG18518 [Caenorhabditis briggsae]CAP35951.2 Protein CBG18518 [Caenorhabditis briggsae]
MLSLQSNGRNLLTPENFMKIVKRCIPEEVRSEPLKTFLIFHDFQLIPSNWICDQPDILSNAEELLRAARGKLGMFESDVELFKTISDFLGVAGCADLLQFDVNHLYKTAPIMHLSLKGVPFLYKVDVYSYALLFVPCPFENWQSDVVQFALKNYWRFMENQLRSHLNSHCEMVQLHVEDFSRFVEKLNGYANDFSMKACGMFEDLPIYLESYKLEDYQVYWTTMLELDVAGSEEVYKVISSYSDKYPFEENKHDYTVMLTWIGVVAKLFGKLITENSMNLLPFHQNVQEKPTVRLFTNGKDNFVIADELLMSLKSKNMDVSKFEEDVQSMPRLSTFDFRDVARKVSLEDMKNIEFIRVKLPSSKLVAVPIPSPDGGYCVLASDALLEIINDIIVAKRVFQTVKHDQLDHIAEFFDSGETFFRSDRGIYFISLTDFDSIKQKWEDTYASMIKDESIEAKSFRRVRNGGFSLEDFKNQLKQLNLSRYFPVDEGGRILYNWKIAQKSREALTMADMHFLVFQMQLTYFYFTFNKIGKFLHGQKVCTDWAPFMTCEWCTNQLITDTAHLNFVCEPVASRLSDDSEEAVEAALPEAEDQVLDNVTSTKQKKKRSKKTKKTEKAESSEESSESSSNPPLTSDTESAEASTKPSSASDQQETGNPRTKESETCQKCFRASQFTRTANEKLRLAKIECKHLKKELAKAELDVEVIKQKEMDKDERIKMLENLLKLKDMELLEKQDTILQMEVEMDRIVHEKSTEIKELKDSLLEKDDMIKTLKAERHPELRFLAPTRSDEHTEKVRNILFKLLEVKDTLLRGNPVGRCRELGQRLIMKCKSRAIENATRIEMIRFCNEVKIYKEAVDNQLVVIRGNQQVKPEEIPELPEFPVLSQEFLENYKDVVKSEVPKICHSLLKAPEVKPGELADNDCLVCIEEMDCEEETIKCECCKRRYHTKCAQQWFKTKRTCPACGSGLSHASDFPVLGRR